MRISIIIIFSILLSVISVYAQEQLPVYVANGPVKQVSVLTYHFNKKTKVYNDSSVYLFSENNKLIASSRYTFADSLKINETYVYSKQDPSYSKNVTYKSYSTKQLSTDTARYWYQYDSKKIRYVTLGINFTENYYYVPNDYYWEKGNLPPTYLRIASTNKICDTNGVLIGEFNFHVSEVGFHQCVKYSHRPDGKILSLTSNLVTDSTKFQKRDSVQMVKLKREIASREAAWNYNKEFTYDRFGNVSTIKQSGQDKHYVILTTYSYTLDKHNNWTSKKETVEVKTYTNGKAHTDSKQSTYQRRKLEYFNATTL